MFNLHGLENIDPSLRVYELLGVEAIYEPFDCVVLLDLVELYYRCLPCLVKDIELRFLLLDNVGVEGIAFLVLSGILCVLVCDLLFHKLINLWG